MSSYPENEQVDAYASWAARAQATPEDLERRRNHVPSLNAVQVREAMKRTVWAAAAAAIRQKSGAESGQEATGRPGERMQPDAAKQLFGGRRGGVARREELPRSEGDRGTDPSRRCAHYLAATRNLRAKRKLAEHKGLTAHESRLLLQLKLGDSVVFREFTERYEPYCNPHCRYCRARGVHVPDTLLHFLTECPFWGQERDAMCIETGLRREDLSLQLLTQHPAAVVRMLAGRIRLGDGSAKAAARRRTEPGSDPPFGFDPPPPLDEAAGWSAWRRLAQLLDPAHGWTAQTQEPVNAEEPRAQPADEWSVSEWFTLV